MKLERLQISRPFRIHNLSAGVQHDGVTSEAGTAYRSEAPKFVLIGHWFSLWWFVDHCLSFCPFCFNR